MFAASRSQFRQNGNRFVVFFAVWSALVFQAQAWWNSEWTYRKQVTIETGGAGVPISQGVGDVPVLLRLHDGNFQFTAAREDGADLRFIAADDKTLLAHHVERYDALLHEALVWVKVPAVAANGQMKFWVYAGNASEKVVRTDDPKGTYDADTTLVYHFAESGGVANDSSGNGNHAQNPGTASTGAYIGGGLRLDGKVVSLPESASLAWTAGGSFTWSAWIKPTQMQPAAVLFSRTAEGNRFAIGLDGGTPYVEAGGQKSAGGAPIAVNTWHHLAVVSNGQQVEVYVDGEPYATLAGAVAAFPGAAQLGADAAAGGVSFTGEIDELQISRVARGAGYVQFAAASQGGEKAAKLLVFGLDETPSDWLAWATGGTFGIILKNLTFDGWIVIVLCFFMAIMSWWVMIGKARYLGTVSKGNAAFFKVWKRLDADVAGLENDGGEDAVILLAGDAESRRALKRSPLYRIYGIGVEEIRHRFALRPDQPRSLTSRAIQAIRATLDGGLVRESQKLNAKIVLLTICISGGPFLGLLGTVVGVMITFAAIAAAGDVNVNAIAPGIAAALLATIAGLAVAIPALFGYNYLLTRIKETTSDLHVFIDEFVTRMAEQYRGGRAE